MATFTKFNQFTRDLIAGVHNFDTHTFKLLLTNSAPVASNSVKANLTEISAGNGYSAGGATVTVAASTSSGVAKVTATDVVVTAAGGSIGPFRSPSTTTRRRRPLTRSSGSMITARRSRLPTRRR